MGWCEWKRFSIPNFIKLESFFVSNIKKKSQIESKSKKKKTLSVRNTNPNNTWFLYVIKKKKGKTKALIRISIAINIKIKRHNECDRTTLVQLPPQINKQTNEHTKEVSPRLLSTCVLVFCSVFLFIHLLYWYCHILKFIDNNNDDDDETAQTIRKTYSHAHFEDWI